MKALSIRQPWASLIIHAGKDVENRVWATAYRGPVLIHAAAKKDRAALLEAVDFVRLRRIELPPSFGSWSDLPYGGVIGIVQLTDCVQRSPSPWFTGPHGFLLRDPVALHFQPVGGQLGFFELEHISTLPCHHQPKQGELF